MGLDEDAVAPGGNGRPGEDRGEHAIAGGGTPCAAGTLDRVGGIKNDMISGLTNPIKGAHVRNKVVVPERDTALGKKVTGIARRLDFFGDIDQVPRREELAFLDVDDPAGACGGEDEIGLAAEEGGDLENIDGFAGDLRIRGRVDIGGDRDAQLRADRGEKGAPFLRRRGRGRT